MSIDVDQVDISIRASLPLMITNELIEPDVDDEDEEIAKAVI